MKARIADPKMKNKRRIIAVYLSDSAGNCAPKDRQLFVIIHWMLVELRIDDPKMKNEKRIISIYLSVSTGDCTPDCR